MIVSPVFASTLGQIFQPFFNAMAWLIAFFYALIPNYAIAIALLTVTVMVITAPLTLKSTKSMLAMQRLQPEMKKLQAKYKGDRATLNEEMMKLYKEHNVNPAGGCLPMVIQIPIFFILYDVIRGLTHTVTVNGHEVARPYYVGHNTKLYHALAATPGQMKALGINLADSLFSHQSSWVGHVPYALLVAIAIALQYLTMRQMNRRNPGAAQANPQMQAMQKYMPLIFAVIYLRIAAGVNIYFIVSALCRMGLQWWAFQTATKQRAALANGAGEEVLSGTGGATGGRPKRRTLMERFADMQQQALEQQQARKAGLEGRALGPGTAPAPKASPKATPKPSTTPKPSATPKSSAAGNGRANGNGVSGGAKSGNGRAPATDDGADGRAATGGNGPGQGHATAGGAKPGSPVGSGGARSGGQTAKGGAPAKSPRANPPSRGNGRNGTSGAAPAAADSDDASKASHPRSKAKRTRKAR
jgi:YidC/Oxa1 family membrane protein insertase